MRDKILNYSKNKSKIYYLNQIFLQLKAAKCMAVHYLKSA